MKYQFNKNRFLELCNEKNLNLNKIKKALGMSNPKAIISWREGGDIRSEHLMRICNAYDVSPAEFFFKDGQLLVTTTLESNKGTNEFSHDTQVALMNQEIQFIKQKAELECEHLRQLMQKDIDLAKKELKLREEIREEIKAEYENEIVRLRAMLIELSTQKDI